MFRIKEGGKNSQNSRLWVLGDDDRDLLVQEGERFSRGAMLLLAVSKMGVGRLIFPPEGVKICGNAYLSMLQKEVAPDIKFRKKAHSEPKKWIWPGAGRVRRTPGGQ